MGAVEVILVVATTVLGLATMAAVFVLLGRAVRKAGGGLAPGWQLRCTRCGRIGDASEAGLVRLGAASVRKYTLGYCSGCGERLRIIAIERKPAAAAARRPTTPELPGQNQATSVPIMLAGNGHSLSNRNARQ